MVGWIELKNAIKIHILSVSLLLKKWTMSASFALMS